jgi:hypothetical protein
MAGKVKIGYEGDGAGAGGGLPRTLYDKVFASHAVHTQDDGQLATAHAAATVRFSVSLLDFTRVTLGHSLPCPCVW